MKRLSILFTLTALFFCQDAFSQITWCPSGATWHYGYVNFDATGYVTIRYTGDTIISGQPCKVLSKTRTYITSMSPFPINEMLGNEYTYSDSNIVYIYRLGTFRVLYDFGKMPGQSWTFPGRDAEVGIGTCDSTSAAMVDSVGIVTISSTPLQYKKFHNTSSIGWQLGGDMIYERIGCNGYMFPEPLMCILDVDEGGPLRCYQDSTFALYETGISTGCDFLLTSEFPSPGDDNLRVFPNPATEVLTISCSSENIIQSITIFDLKGNNVRQFNGFGSEISFSVADLPAGFYLYNGTFKTGERFRGRFGVAN